MSFNDPISQRGQESTPSKTPERQQITPGDDLRESSVEPEPPSVLQTKLSFLQTVGAFAFIGGIVAAVYFLFFFSIDDFAAMADRQNGIIAGFGFALIGVFAMYAGRSKRP